MGHVHKREIISKEPWIVFPGNIQGRYIKETGAKGASLVTVEDGRIIKVEALELDVLRWAVCRVDLSECETSEKIYDVVRQALEHELDQDQRDRPTAGVPLGASRLRGRSYRFQSNTPVCS